MKRLLCALITALLTLSSLQANQEKLSLSMMSETEQKAAGIDKLSPEEKHALDTWLLAHSHEKPQPIMQKSKIMHGEFTIKATQDLGRYITLENGLTYEIPSRSRKKTMAWKVGEKVRVIEPVRPVNYKLENIIHDQSIGGKITNLPKPAKTPETKTTE